MNKRGIIPNVVLAVTFSAQAFAADLPALPDEVLKAHKAKAFGAQVPSRVAVCNPDEMGAVIVDKNGEGRSYRYQGAIIDRVMGRCKVNGMIYSFPNN